MKKFKVRTILALSLAVGMLVSSGVTAFASNTPQLSDLEYASVNLSDCVEAVLIDEDQNVIHLDADDISVNLQQGRSRSTGANEYVLSYAAGTDKVTSGDQTKSGFSVTAYGDIYWTDNPLGTVNDLRKVSGGWRCSDGSSTYGTKDIWYGVNGQYHKKTNNTTFSYSVNSTFSAGAWPNAGMKTQTKIKNAKGETATLILDFYIPLIN